MCRMARWRCIVFLPVSYSILSYLHATRIMLLMTADGEERQDTVFASKHTLADKMVTNSLLCLQNASLVLAEF